MSSELELLKAELDRLGASDFQTSTFEADPRRARSAIAKAIEAGASRPISYALAVFNADRLEQKPQRTANRYGTVDPLYTDDGDRIWHWHEVDDEWRRGYLRDCSKALAEEREPAARYQPSSAEFDELKKLIGPLAINPQALRGTAESALRAWGMLWFGDAEVAA